jgi:putative addiction module component (TIGR02574 family)
MHAQLLEQVRQLTAREQVELVDEILEGLPEGEETEAGPSLSPTQVAELDRRMAEHLADPNSAIPWSEVKREINERFGFDL